MKKKHITKINNDLNKKIKENGINICLNKSPNTIRNNKLNKKNCNSLKLIKSKITVKSIFY